jgi:hypothetical protein
LSAWTAGASGGRTQGKLAEVARGPGDSETATPASGCHPVSGNPTSLQRTSSEENTSLPKNHQQEPINIVKQRILDLDLETNSTLKMLFLSATNLKTIPRYYNKETLLNIRSQNRANNTGLKQIFSKFKNEDIIVDVIMTSSANLKDVQAEDYKSIGMLFRYLEISSFYNSMDGLLRAKFAYSGVDFRWIISPSGSIPSSIYPLVSSIYILLEVNFD